MTDETTVLFTISLDSLEAEEDERLKFAQKLLPELRNLDEVIKADQAEDLNPEAGSKGFTTLLGVLQAEVSVKNIKAFFGFLAERIADKPIKIRAKVGEKEVEIEAKSKQELEAAEERALSIIEKLSR